MPNADPSHIDLSVSTRGDGYEGFVVIDSLVDGRSAGGVRISDQLSVDEVRELAREMSLKFALFHLPRGGAKAGLQLSPALDAEGRHRALRDFGRRISPLVNGGLYYPGMDLNCGPEELRSIYRGAGIELGRITDTSFFTGLSIFHCLEACAEALPADGQPLRLAVEGFGSVARHLAERLDSARYMITAVSTLEGAVLSESGFDPRDLARRKVAAGDAFVRELEGRQVERADVLVAEVDILLPSSRTWVISRELAGRMPVRAILPIANAPYAAGSLEILAAKKTLCLPGYMSNVGGVLASSLYDLGVTIPEIERLFASVYRSVVEDILRLAVRTGRPVTAITGELVDLHRVGRRPRYARSLPARLHQRFLARRLPKSWRARQARREFLARMASIRAEIARMGSDA
ncbi:MAG TPA: Glu/Leu/Phe/Val dehydrogenase dimerization domain-containing protein [Candidatus Krumholzibacteria bacterium]|jgi:glutamate dehydrogenase (NAD(P)+)